MVAENLDGPVKAVVQFCRFARANGLNAGAQEAAVSLQAAGTAGIADWEAFRFASRAVLCSSKEDWDLFDRVFEDFWSGSVTAPLPADRAEGIAELQKREERRGVESVRALSSESAGSAEEAKDEGKAVFGASAAERLRKIDFSHVPQSDLATLDKISLRLLRQMSLRLSRRLRIMKSRGRVDLRRTIRRSIGRGGELIDLSYKGKKTRRPKLVVFLDVSGSMNLYSIFLLKFAYVLQKHFKQVATFIFSTRLADITGTLKGRQLADALGELSLAADGWSGGTKIGHSLREFSLLHGRKLLSCDTFFVILSDGWDTGEPELLEEELRKIKRHVRRLFWLNPLLGLDSYQPMTRGMSAALPYIDVFAPAHNLESLLDLERRLKAGLHR